MFEYMGRYLEGEGLVAGPLHGGPIGPSEGLLHPPGHPLAVSDAPDEQVGLGWLTRSGGALGHTGKALPREQEGVERREAQGLDVGVALDAAQRRLCHRAHHPAGREGKAE